MTENETEQPKENVDIFFGDKHLIIGGRTTATSDEYEISLKWLAMALKGKGIKRILVKRGVFASKPDMIIEVEDKV